MMFVQFNFGEGSASATTIKIESAAPMALPTATSHNLGGTPKVADCTGWCQQLRSYLHSTFVVDSWNTKLTSIDMHLLWYVYQSSKEWTDNLHVWGWHPEGATAVLVKANAGCGDGAVSQRYCSCCKSMQDPVHNVDVKKVHNACTYSSCILLRDCCWRRLRSELLDARYRRLVFVYIVNFVFPPRGCVQDQWHTRALYVMIFSHKLGERI